MTPPRRLGAAFAVQAATAALAALTTAGCQSQWYQQAEHTESVRTEVVIRSEPAGATVFFNGVRQDVAPVRIPVEYRHRTEQWVRQSNQGASFRESNGVVGTILFPVWIPLSFFHAQEEAKRHVYEGNVHAVRCELDGHDDAERSVELQGEEQVDVLVPLVRSAR